MKKQKTNKEEEYLEQKKKTAFALTRLLKAFLFSLIVGGGLLVRVLPSKAGNGNFKSSQALVPQGVSIRAENEQSSSKGVVVSQSAPYWGPKNKRANTQIQTNDQLNTELPRARKTGGRGNLLQTQAVGTIARRGFPSDDGDPSGDPAQKLINMMLATFEKSDISLFVKRLKNFYVSNQTILNKKNSPTPLDTLRSISIPTSYMVGEWENLLVIPKINQNYTASQKIVSKEVSRSNWFKSLLNRNRTLQESTPIFDFLFETDPLKTLGQSPNQAERFFYNQIRSAYDRQRETLGNNIENTFGFLYTPNNDRRLISFAQNPTCFYQNLTKKSPLIPPHFQVIRDAAQVVFNQLAQQRAESLAKFPFFFDGTYCFIDKNPNATINEMLVDYTKNSILLEKQIERAEYSGVEYSKDPENCFSEMQSNLLDFVLGYPERVSDRPESAFVSEQNALRILAVTYKNNLFVAQCNPAFDMKEWDYHVRKELFDNLENSKLIKKVLQLEIGELVGSILEDGERFEYLLSFHENQAMLLSNKASKLIGSRLKTPLKRPPNVEELEFLKNVARLYSPGFFTDMGEQQLLNWVTFCQELRGLAKNSVFLKKVCLHDHTYYNNNVARIYFGYLSDAGLAFVK